MLNKLENFKIFFYIYALPIKKMNLNKSDLSSENLKLIIRATNYVFTICQKEKNVSEASLFQNQICQIYNLLKLPHNI